MWIEILSKSFEETVEIKKDQLLGFLVIEPTHLKFKYETSNKKKKKKFKPKDYIFLTAMTLLTPRESGSKGHSQRNQGRNK